VAGVVGVLQALETVKILTEMDGVLSGRLLLFDGSGTNFRNVKLRQRVAECAVCGDNPTITTPIDYEQFCGSKAHDKVVDIDMLKDEENVNVQKLDHLLKEGVVVDVRPELEFAMCRLPNTVNLPYARIKTNKGLRELKEIVKSVKKVYVLCRRGNDSQRSVKYLRDNFPDSSVRFVNVKGGLHAYSKFVDSTFPVY
jgi:adenylyltransferase/sulfurtransferase